MTDESRLSDHESVRTPPWCEWGRGNAPVLLVAPHGGRRAPVDGDAPPRHLRVNDVYTPDVTRELAQALDAGFVINCGMDRNVLDLNRISQVRKHAPWFLQLLTHEVGRIIDRHGRVELLFVHGWNTGRSTCDLGIGGIDTPAGLHAPEGAHLTVDAAYLQRRIEALRAACARIGISAPIGERYPGSHRNNLLQLFTPRAADIDDPCAQRIARWVAEGRINALQLELSIPLRWPGQWRTTFVAAVAEAFGRSGSATNGAHRITTPEPGHKTPPAALQFYDPAAGIGLLAGIGHAGPRITSGRLLLFLGGQRVALFTGEEVHAVGARVGSLAVRQGKEGMQLEFAGPILMLADAAVYLDLEAALAQSRLVAAEVRMQFTPVHSDGATAASVHFGAVRGVVSIDGERWDIDTAAFANAAAFRASGTRQQTMLAAAFGGTHAVLSRVIDGAADCTGLHFTRATSEMLGAVRIAVATDGDLYTPTRFELSCAGLPALRGEPMSRMTILRPAGDAGYLRVTFGVARFDWSGEVGYGLYEHARPVFGK